MNMFTVGLFDSREDAEQAINSLHNDLDIPKEDISYIYRNTEGEVEEGDADDTMGESTGKGAAIGGTLGALAGLAVFAGIIPVVGPLLAAGPIAAALGFTGAAGAAVAGGATGAVAGGLIGALSRLGVSGDKAKHYADRVNEGNILVATHADESVDVAKTLMEAGATDVETYAPAV